MRRIIATVIVSLMLHVTPAVAEESFIELDGYCHNGEPVLNRPPLPTEDPYCNGPILVIRYPDQDLSDDINRLPSHDDLELPDPDVPGFAFWVTVSLNDQWLISAPSSKERKEPDAMLLADSGRVVMPIRFFTEAIGGEVAYSSDGTVTLSWQGRTITLQLGESHAMVDGKTILLDQPPLLVWGRTMVPTRFVMETFGADIGWNSSAGLVTVHLPDSHCSNRTLCFELGR